MTKIVLCHNSCSFSLSEAAIRLGRTLSNDPTWLGVPLVGEYYPEGGQADRFYGYVHGDLDRRDPILVQVVETLGDKANGTYSRLKIYDLAPGTKFYIRETDNGDNLELQDEIEWETA